MILSQIDLIVIALYCIGLIGISYWVSREEAGHEKNSADYFLASKSLPWWAIGASLIAANISAEQIIGMSGSGYALGLGIAAYEWMAAITLLLVGKYFIPVFLKQGIYTMPQFLEQRYDTRVKLTMAIFWIGVYVLVNLTSVLYLGALAMNTITGFSITDCLLFLAIFSVVYSIYGGLKAVAFTDIIQVVLLVFGGLLVSYLALDKIAEGAGSWAGFQTLLIAVPEKFDLILSRDNPHYMSLPGISVLIGGMWVMNFSYWGFNQYITQRALAAKNLAEAQKGIIFGAFLKLLMPLIVVIPGVAAVVLVPDLHRPDEAFPEMMKLVPHGLLGIVFAALIAAIASSLSSMTNSISTIFTLDIYKPLINPDASEGRLVMVGRLIAVGAMTCAVIIAEPLLGNFEQAFQYIQEFTGFFTPGIVVIFTLGIFWKKTTANAALAAAISSAALSLALKIFWPELPFMDRVSVVFLACIAIAVAISLIEKGEDHDKAVNLKEMNFSTSTSYNVASLAIVLILVGLYATWW